jgi:protein-arginine kinase activator protein McsA
LKRLLRLDELHCAKKGLNKQEIDLLPTFDFRGPTDDQDENCRTCYICYEVYEKNEKITILSCYHKYHKKCIEPWFKVE